MDQLNSLDGLDLGKHGDRHELIVPMTFRVDQKAAAESPKKWIRFRPGIPGHYEKMAMAHYSVFYFLGRAVKRVTQDAGAFLSIRKIRMLGIPVRKGRLFYEGEDRAIVLSERMAALMFPGETAIGRHLILSGEATLEVTGIVGDVRNGGLTTSSDPEIYLLSNRERLRQYVLLRADTRAMPFVRDAFRELDPRLTIQFETLDDRVRNMRARPRFQSMLLSGFAAAGLVLAAIGLYGVMALLTAQRTGEIGVRMALGATAGDIRTMVLRQAAYWTGAGMAIGLFGEGACGRLIEGLLYGVKASAPLPLAAAVVSLTLAGLVAAWMPARRASHVEPIKALREL